MACVHGGAYAFALDQRRTLDAVRAARYIAADVRAGDDELRHARRMPRGKSHRIIGAHRAAGQRHRCGNVQRIQQRSQIRYHALEGEFTHLF